jgi:hypothetical protein
MELTPVKVYWKPVGATAFTDLGGTLGNVKVAIATEKAEIKADQTGTTPLDRRVSGQKYTVVTKITQAKDFLISSYVFPNAELLGTTPYNGASPSAALQFNNAVGSSDLQFAGQLKLHPQDVADDDASYDYLFYKACPTEASEITYGPTEQSAFNIEWTVYPDTDVTPYRFFRYGSEDIT